MIEVRDNGVVLVEGMDYLLNLLNGVSLAPDTFILMLFKAGWTPTADSVYADFLAQQCDYTGYADGTVTWTGPVHQAGPISALVGNNVAIPATGAAVGNTVAGAVLVARFTGPPVANTGLVYYLFGVPITIDSAGDFVGGKPVLELPALPGSFVLEN